MLPAVCLSYVCHFYDFYSRVLSCISECDRKPRFIHFTHSCCCRVRAPVRSARSSISQSIFRSRFFSLSDRYVERLQTELHIYTYTLMWKCVCGVCEWCLEHFHYICTYNIVHLICSSGFRLARREGLFRFSGAPFPALVLNLRTKPLVKISQTPAQRSRDCLFALISRRNAANLLNMHAPVAIERIFRRWPLLIGLE